MIVAPVGTDHTISVAVAASVTVAVVISQSQTDAVVDTSGVSVTGDIETGKQSLCPVPQVLLTATQTSPAATQAAPQVTVIELEP